MKLNKFLKECHQKDVFKKLSLYVVTSWVVIQVFSTIWEPLGFPKASTTILLIILLLGFPINMYFVWRFDLVKQEKKKLKINKQGREVPGKYVKSSFQKTYFSFLSIISILFIAGVIVVVQNNFLGSVEFKEFDGSDKIAVETFGNNTGDPKNDIIGKMAADWIIHGISENNIGQVISQKIIDDYSNIVIASVGPSRSENLLKEYFNPGRIVSGNFYQKGDKLLFQGSLIDANKNDEQISFELVECDSDSPLDCIEKLKQLILGYLVMNEENLLTLESTPPKFEAYQHVITAKANSKDEDIYIDEIEKAIAADPDYFEAKLFELVFYYNKGNYQKSDSLLKEIKPNSSTTPRQTNLLNMYEALLDGNNRKVSDYLRKEYNNNPYDIETNSSLMVIYLQFINQPELVNAVFEEINSEELIIENCLHCEYRIYTQAMADIELNKYDEAIDLLTETLIKIEEFYLNKPLASAYIRSNRLKDLDLLVANLELTSSKEDLMDLFLYIGAEFQLINNHPKANSYLQKVIDSDLIEATSFKAKAYYLKGDYKEAELMYQQLHDDNPTDLTYLSRLASCLYKNQKKVEGKQMINSMESLRTDFQFGELDYCIAAYYAIAEDEEKVFNYLFKSISQGNYYRITSFQNDPHFVQYFESERFQSILNYWH